MNKYHGSNFEEYLKEKGTFEAISVLAPKRWEALQTEAPEDTSDITQDFPRGSTDFSNGSVMRSIISFQDRIEGFH